MSESKGILGIHNRTENYQTATRLAKLLNPNSVAARRNLVKKLSSDADRDFVEVELFWHGFRDYVDCSEKSKDEIRKSSVEFYDETFKDLGNNIRTKEYRNKLLQNPQKNIDHCYNPKTKRARENFFNNLIGTEIDIVLQTPSHLFIGEAKYLEGFSANSDLVLVHQLIRQFVMAKTVLHLTESSEMHLVQFIVGMKCDVAYGQVNFMEECHELQRNNILTWEQLSEIIG